MNVLSLFDGMSCGQIALKEMGIKVDNYFASEIKKHAIEFTKYHFPETIHLGDVRKLKTNDLPKIDLLIGGSPCQDLSYLSSRSNEDRAGLKGAKSSLFWEYVRIFREVNPTYFFLENVGSMKTEDKRIITKELGVHPVQINSNLVSAQERNRYYWTNIGMVQSGLFGDLVSGIKQPKDKGIRLQDVIDYNAEPEEVMSKKKLAYIAARVNTMHIALDGEKSMPITAKGYDGWNSHYITMPNGLIRDLTVNEFKALQTIPDQYTFNCSKSKATNLIGDGWTIDVIKHIFGYLNLEQ
jgi:DNA (cytosine-5)-methyltransferase 3A